VTGAGSGLVLVGRRDECDQLSGLLTDARAGRGRALVLRGAAGIGKTALLEFVQQAAAGCRVALAAGVESELELDFAGLHQLCGPHLDRLDTLPGPQGRALATAFGLRSGDAPDRFFVGLAVLTLLSEVARDEPLVCIVDDAQWLGPASAQILRFVARRLATLHVAMVFATRGANRDDELTGLPALDVQGLADDDSGRLLRSVLPAAVDPKVRDRIIAECEGNPLALLELPQGLSAAGPAFGAAIGPGATPVAQRLEQGFLRRLQALPPGPRQLLLTAAAEPLGGVPLFWSAAELLGLGAVAATAAEAAGMLDLQDGVRFRHPLLRSAVYRSATPAERREVHRTLANVTDPELDPDRRAWHRAWAAVGPDEEVALELEHSADRALAGGTPAAAAAFLERSAALTPEPSRRGRRALEAARGKVSAGAFADAFPLLSVADLSPLSEADRARSQLLHAHLSVAANRCDEALPLLLAAARRLEPLDADLARDAYLDAFSAALLAGRPAVGPGAREVARAVRAAPPPRTPHTRDVLLEAFALLFTEGYAAAVPDARQAVEACAGQDPAAETALGSSWLAAATAACLWDDGSWDVLTRRHLDLARHAGGLGALPLALNARAVVQLFAGELTAAASLVQEIRTVTDVTGSALAPYGEVGLLALRGAAEHAEPLIRTCLDDAVVRGEGAGVNMALWAGAVLCNGQGRYEEALRAAREATAGPLRPGPSTWALTELVEAGARSGETAVAEAALEQLSAMALASGTDWALGVAASRRATLSGGPCADELHRDAIERLGRTRMRVDLARAQLLYGEWLRREGRRVEARGQLRTAHQALTAMGLEAFADRARHELLATGETVRKRTLETSGQLTAQEAHIARLAAQGLTNPEIGAALFVSPRTVEWHLRKTFSKLGVSTRRELRRSLPELDQTTVAT
jgi:DNA-binding CsgD family transcriptional regulator